jgi:RNA polymerase sigma-70 factor (ECF subfamily)
VGGEDGGEEFVGEGFLHATMPALDLVHNLARRLTRDAADAEDLVQETYLRAWRAWVADGPPRRVQTWLATICLNAGRDAARRARARPEEPSADLTGVPVGAAAAVAADDDVAEAALRRVQRADLEAALAGLPEPQRIAVTLVDLCGLTAAEAAEAVGCPRGTVLARVHRGRKALALRVGATQGEGRSRR